MTYLECSVEVRTAAMACVPAAAPSGGALLDRIIGGQNVYMRLASVSSSWNGGTNQFHTSVTVQNLLRQSMGTPDGFTVAGFRVYFHSGPITTGGSGMVTVANADGTDLFPGGNQPFYHYGQKLAPYEISAAKQWVFDVDPTVTSFRFGVYVSTPLADEAGPMLDRVWDGSEGSAWEVAGNWADGAVPDSTSTVAIPADSLLGAAAQPVLAQDARVLHLRVGLGSVLDLDGHVIRLDGNLDVPGAIVDGTVSLAGAGALVGGTLPSVRVTGSATLQSPVTATGAVSIADGSVQISDRPLSIQLP